MSQLPELLQNIAIGLIGAAIAGLFVNISSKYKKRQLRKKHPIHGNYISYFEDELDGKEFVATSLTKITQSGLNFRGVNEVPNGKSWTLEGRIVDNGYISGVYLADSPHDPGNGTFFLKVDGDDLDGLWSGYDSVNHSITGGRYWFRRVKKVKVVDYLDRFQAKALSIADDVLGAGYLNDLNDGEGLHEVKTKLAVVNGEVAGFITYNLEPPGFLASSPKYEKAKFSTDLRSADKRSKMGHIRIVGVDQNTQGRGVGTMLIAAAEKHLIQLGAETILVFGWTSPKGTHIGGVIEKLGYDEIEEVSNFWTEESQQLNYECAVCGTPCVCSVKIFKKSISKM